MKGELEHRALKGDFNCNARILHFSMNPATIAEQQAEEKQKALLREVEELRIKVAQGGANVTTSVLQAQGNFFLIYYYYYDFLFKKNINHQLKISLY